MFFQSKARKALIAGGDALLLSYRDSALAAGAANPDHEAVLMFSGFTQFAISVLLQTGKIKPKDYRALVDACRETVEKLAPDHAAGDSYLEDASTLVSRALGTVQGDPEWYLAWAGVYYEGLEGASGISAESFLAPLLRDSRALMQGEPLGG